MPRPSVSLRPLVPADAEQLALWGADEVFAAQAGWTPSQSEGKAIAWWRSRIARPDPKLLRLAAVHDGEVVGYCDLYDDEAGARELGYVIGPAGRWRQGLGTATARAGLVYGFEVLTLPRIWAEAVDANEASVRVLQRLGMREFEGGEAEPFLGKPSRYRRFEIHRDDWRVALKSAEPFGQAAPLR